MTLNRFCFLLLLVAAIGSFFSSRKGMRRVPETTLLLYGVVGGWPGAILGQQLFRHKTQKQPFKTWFWISVVVSLSAMMALYYFSPFTPY